MAVPVIGPTIQIQKWLQVPEARAGPRDRAGFMLAPETPPPTRMSNNTTPPIAMAAAAPTARVSVATAMITNINCALSTHSTTSAEPGEMPIVLAPRFPARSGHTASRRRAASTAPAS